MPYVFRYRDFPILYLNTPEENARYAAAKKRLEDSLPVVYEGEINGKPARVRGYIRDSDICGICEYWYREKWHRLQNFALCDELKLQSGYKICASYVIGEQEAPIP